MSKSMKKDKGMFDDQASFFTANFCLSAFNFRNDLMSSASLSRSFVSQKINLAPQLQEKFNVQLS